MGENGDSEPNRTDAPSGPDAVAEVAEENLLRDLVHHSLGLICAHQLDGTLITVNLAAAEALGYTPQELEGRNLRELVEPRLQPRFAAYLSKIARDGKGKGYLRMVTKTGARVTWVYRNKLHRQAGKQSIVLGHAQDVTWRLELERRLYSTNERYRRLFDEAPVAYHEIDRSGTVVKVNQAECELLGCNKEDLLGVPVWKRVAPEMEEISRSSVLAKLSGNQPLEPFFRNYVRSDGNRLRLNIHENLILSDAGEIEGIRSTMLDVTEQFKAERELLRLNAELDRRVAERTRELNASNDRMREFVYTVSHDLQEPLRSIGSFAALLKNRYSNSLDADGVEFLDFVTSGAVRMTGLIQDLLAVSRVLHDDSQEFAPVAMSEVVEVALKNLSTLVQNSAAEITCGPLPEVHANPNRLVQLMQNLIGNSIKYRSHKAPVVRIEARQSEGAWTISVTDNGIGIPDGDRQRVFGLFKRSESGRTPGSGVGLAICQAIVERHGGRIWAEAAPEGGAVLLFTLPGSRSFEPTHAEIGM